MTKPPYKVPSMAQINAVESNGFRVASTFSGCGGSSLGYRMAGYKVIWANEFVEAAANTYRANKSHDCILDTRDIRQVEAADLPADLDILDGSPPCSSFSMAGKRAENWGKTKIYSDTKQRTDDLFEQYIRLVKGCQPKVFVAENVTGLVRGKAKGYFLQILDQLKSCGYQVRCKILDAQWLGVPQARQRAIFVGVRNDLGKVPSFPKPLPYRYSIAEAFDDLDAEVEPEASIERFAIGKEWHRVGQGGKSEKYFSLVKPLSSKPSPTITANCRGTRSIASVCHPTECRKFSIAELKRLCSFPDDFKLTGGYTQQYERLGRAVPPLMMRAIAETIKDQILGD